MSNLGMHIKKDEKQDYITCESCTKECTDIETMKSDNSGNWFCAECWAELSPVMRKEWQDLREKGEIDEHGNFT